MRVQHNIMAMNSYRYLSGNNKALSNNLEKLSSGYRINRAGDDAAGLAISEKMRAQITGLDAAQKNVNDGISLVKTAEGAMQEIQDMLNRMEYLADQSANGTYEDDVDRENLQKEATALGKEIDRIAKSTNFNGINLLDGTQAATKFADGGDGLTVKATDTSTDKKTGDITAANVSVNFKSVKIEKLSDTGTVKLNIGGSTIESAKITGSGTNGAVQGVDIAKAFVGKSFELDGVTYKAEIVNDKNGDATSEIKFVADTKDFNILTKDMISGFASSTTLEGGGGLELQIGDTTDTYNKMSVAIKSMDTFNMNVASVRVDTQAAASVAVDVIKDAINYVSEVRGDLGAIQNRLEHTNNNLAVMEENITDAESTIRDTDVADEMMAYTKNNILIQSAQAMLAQANQVPQGVLQLMQ